MRLLLLASLSLTQLGCSALLSNFSGTGTTQVMQVEEGTKICAPITNVEQLMPVYVIQDTSKYDFGATIPAGGVPIPLEFGKDKSHEMYSLADKLNQDNIAIQSVLYTMVMLRNAAPCDELNIKMSWETMKDVVRYLKETYAPLKMQQASTKGEEDDR